MQPRRALAAALAAALLAASPPVRAAAPGLTAREWFAKASADHKSGNYAEAVAGYKEAYKLEPHPVYLFNIATAARLGGGPVEALAYYEKFLAADAGTSLRPEVEARIKELRPLAAAAAAKRAPPPDLGATAGPGVVPVGDTGTKTPGIVAGTPPAEVPGTSAVTPGAETPARRSDGGRRRGLVFGIVLGSSAAAAIAAGVLVGVLLAARDPFRRYARENGIDPDTGIIDHRGLAP